MQSSSHHPTKIKITTNQHPTSGAPSGVPAITRRTTPRTAAAHSAPSQRGAVRVTRVKMGVFQCRGRLWHVRHPAREAPTGFRMRRRAPFHNGDTSGELDTWPEGHRPGAGPAARSSTLGTVMARTALGPQDVTQVPRARSRTSHAENDRGALRTWTEGRRPAP